MSNQTHGSSQFVRLPNGQRALYDAYDYSLHILILTKQQVVSYHIT